MILCSELTVPSVLVKLIDVNGFGQKVSSQLCLFQASTGEASEGQWGAQGQLSSFCSPLSSPSSSKSCSVTGLACRTWHFLGDLLLGCREGSTLALEPDMSGQILGPPRACFLFYRRLKQ